MTQRKEVKEQKDEAELYQQKVDELNDLKSEHVLWQIWRIKLGTIDIKFNNNTDTDIDTNTNTKTNTNTRYGGTFRSS